MVGGRAGSWEACCAVVYGCTSNTGAFSHAGSTVVQAVLRLMGLGGQGHGRPTAHKPELIMSNFGTRLGHRISRLFASLFCQVPVLPCPSWKTFLFLIPAIFTSHLLRSTRRGAILLDQTACAALCFTCCAVMRPLPSCLPARGSLTYFM